MVARCQREFASSSWKPRPVTKSTAHRPNQWEVAIVLKCGDLRSGAPRMILSYLVDLGGGGGGGATDSNRRGGGGGGGGVGPGGRSIATGLGRKSVGGCYSPSGAPRTILSYPGGRRTDGRGTMGDSEWQDQCRRWTGNRNGRCCW